MTEHLSCALCEDKSLFCMVEDIWWPPNTVCVSFKFYQAVIEKTSKRKYRVGGGATMTGHLSCACSEDI